MTRKAIMKKEEIVHLYWRAGFGISPSELNLKQNQSRQEVVRGLFELSGSMKELGEDMSDLQKDFLNFRDSKSSALRKEFITKSKDRLVKLNVSWIERASATQAVLGEKMTFFWDNHFVTRSENAIHVQKYNNVLRKYALGNFRELVRAISESAAMINYLNLITNTKSHPNENFAREFLELFTLGRDVLYTENDIHEVARAFTGYRNNLESEFDFAPGLHDNEEKTVLGEKGHFTGRDIIDIVLKKKECARFICKKIFVNFINDVIDEEQLAEITEVFYKNYEIKELLEHIFMSDWFYEERHRGVKIKSPVELLVGIKRTVPITFDNEQDYIRLERLLRQVIFQPPNVAGLPGGRNWIDPNSLLLRMNLATYVLNNSTFEFEDKGVAEDTFEAIEKKAKKRGKVFGEPDWEHFDKEFSGYNVKEITTLFISGELNTANCIELLKDKRVTLREGCLLLMSMPEYQLC